MTRKTPRKMPLTGDDADSLPSWGRGGGSPTGWRSTACLWITCGSSGGLSTACGERCGSRCGRGRCACGGLWSGDRSRVMPTTSDDICRPYGPQVPGGGRGHATRAGGVCASGGYAGLGRTPDRSSCRSGAAPSSSARHRRRSESPSGPARQQVPESSPGSRRSLSSPTAASRPSTRAATLSRALTARATSPPWRTAPSP